MFPQTSASGHEEDDSGTLPARRHPERDRCGDHATCCPNAPLQVSESPPAGSLL